jgi:DNA-directed RNA polymerase specialized sigma54-like protein
MNIHQRIAELTDLAKTCAQDGRFYTAANRLRELADEIEAHISTLTRPAPGKVMHAPSGAFVPPLAHLTEEQQRAVRLADIEREHLAGVKRVDRAMRNARRKP